MKVGVDTNVLVRAAVCDDPVQAAIAARILSEAELIAIPLPWLCEFVWVLRKIYGFPVDDVRRAMLALFHTANVEMNRPAVEAGLAALEAGGDFADGAIAHEGQSLGGEVFTSFDRKAVKLVSALGLSAKAL